MEASSSMEKTGLEGWGLFFPVIGDFCQRMYCSSLSPMLWLFIFSLDVGYWQSWLQSLRALLRVTFIWRMLKHRGNNYKQQLQDIFHPKGHRKKPAQLWTMRVQLRIGANPFIKLAQIPKADRSVQCGNFWVDLVLICYLNSRFGLGSTPCSWQRARCASPAKLPSVARAAPRPRKATEVLLVLQPGPSTGGSCCILPRNRSSEVAVVPEIFFTLFLSTWAVVVGKTAVLSDLGVFSHQECSSLANQMLFLCCCRVTGSPPRFKMSRASSIPPKCPLKPGFELGTGD